MSDGFQAGIAAAQQGQQQKQQQASVLASIYSTMLQTNAAFEADKMRLSYTLQAKLAEEKGQTERFGMAQTGETVRAGLAQQGQDRRAALEQEVKYRIAAEDRLQEAATEDLKSQRTFAASVYGSDQQYRGQIESQMIQARTSAANNLLTNRVAAYGRGLDAEQTPGEALTGAYAVTGMDPQAGVKVASALPNRKAQREGEAHQAGLLKTQADIANTQSQMQERGARLQLDAFKADTDRQQALTQQIAQGTVGYLKSQEALASWTQQWLSTTSGKFKGNAAGAQRAMQDWQTLRSLRDAAAGGTITPEQYQQQALQVMAANPDISPTVWQEGLLTDSLVSGNASRAAGSMAVAVQMLPSDQMVAMHAQQPEEQRGIINQIASSITFNVADRAGSMAAGAGMSQDDLLNSLYAAYGQDAKSKTGKATAPPDALRKKWDAMTPWELRQELTQYAGVSRAAVDGIGRFDKFNATVSGTLFGDAARGAYGQQGQGDFGLVGDAAIAVVGGKVFQAMAPMARGIAGGIWKGAKGAPIVGKAFQAAETQAGNLYRAAGRPFGGPQKLLGPYGTPYPEGMPAPRPGAGGNPGAFRIPGQDPLEAASFNAARGAAFPKPVLNTPWQNPLQQAGMQVERGVLFPKPGAIQMMETGPIPGGFRAVPPSVNPGSPLLQGQFTEGGIRLPQPRTINQSQWVDSLRNGGVR